MSVPEHKLPLWTRRTVGDDPIISALASMACAPYPQENLRSALATIDKSRV
jgi:hypothetical protein